MKFRTGALLSALLLVSSSAVFVQRTVSAAPQKPASVQDGKYVDKDGSPTYSVKEDGAVDWYTYSGYRRYHSECHVCHGPDGMGSTYAPALADSLKNMSYADFAAVVIQGRETTLPSGAKSIMPEFGTNKNVVCYLDDIYVYLKARADDAVPRARPAKREDKPKAFDEAEKACLG